MSQRPNALSPGHVVPIQASPGGVLPVTPRRIIKSTKAAQNYATQLVQLDGGRQGQPLSFLSNSLASENSASDVRSDIQSYILDDNIEASMSSFFTRRPRGNVAPSHIPRVPRSSENSRRRLSSSSRVLTTSRHELEGSVLSYSDGGSFYDDDDASSTSSDHSHSSCGSAESSYTAISESVPSCSLTVLHNDRQPLPGRMRKQPPVMTRTHSESFGSLFGDGGIDPYSGTSLHSHSAAGALAGVGSIHTVHNLHSDDHNSVPQPAIAPKASLRANAVGSPVDKDAPAGLPAAAAAAACSHEKPKKSVRIAPESTTETVFAAEVTDENDSPSSPAVWRVQEAEKLERIGRGSFGDVFRGIDKETGKVIAIKEILVAKDFTKDIEKQIQALEREIRVMRKLHHPNTINYLGAIRGDNSLNIFMEFIDGGTIASQLKESGPFTEEVARGYTAQLLNGLEYLHDRQILHRDLKGDNLFLTNDGVLKVGDFGTSKELVTTLNTDSATGTPNFMAPEVIACTGHSYAADIWSVGCCLLEMLTGAPPFAKADNYMAVMFAIIKGQLGEQVPDHISDSAKDFIRVATMTDPKDRWTAHELREHPWILGTTTASKSINAPHSTTAKAANASPESSATHVDTNAPPAPAEPVATEKSRQQASIAEALRSDAGLPVPYRAKNKSNETALHASSASPTPTGSMPPLRQKNKSKPLDVTALNGSRGSQGTSPVHLKPLRSPGQCSGGSDGLVVDHETGGASSSPSSQSDTPVKRAAHARHGSGSLQPIGTHHSPSSPHSSAGSTRKSGKSSVPTRREASSTQGTRNASSGGRTAASRQGGTAGHGDTNGTFSPRSTSGGRSMGSAKKRAAQTARMASAKPKTSSARSGSGKPRPAVAPPAGPPPYNPRRGNQG